MLAALRPTILAVTTGLALLAAGIAAANPLEPGWTLDNAMSNLRFQSVKNLTKVESSSFATFSGTIAPDGAAEVAVLLDSVDTSIDIRNVRMRFLFFETFNFPEAKITARIDPAQLAGLQDQRRVTMQLPFSLDLHGVRKTFVAEVVATLLTDDMVSVASATVSFDFIFRRNGPDAGTPAIAAAPAEAPAPASAALEEQGEFSREACIGRFETLSRSGGIYFGSNSAEIDAASAGLLRNLADIVRRCPGLTIEVSGHTDSDGPSDWNQTLSEMRATSVADYLSAQGIEAARLVTVGHGEEQPIVPNTSRENKGRNRRIEFAVIR